MKKNSNKKKDLGSSTMNTETAMPKIMNIRSTMHTACMCIPA